MLLTVLAGVQAALQSLQAVSASALSPRISKFGRSKTWHVAFTAVSSVSFFLERLPSLASFAVFFLYDIDTLKRQDSCSVECPAVVLQCLADCLCLKRSALWQSAALVTRLEPVSPQEADATSHREGLLPSVICNRLWWR